MKKVISILLSLLLIVNIWIFSDNAYLEKAWADEITVTTPWGLVNNNDISNITIPGEALEIISARIKWKGYTTSEVQEQYDTLFCTETAQKQVAVTLTYPSLPNTTRKRAKITVSAPSGTSIDGAYAISKLTPDHDVIWGKSWDGNVLPKGTTVDMPLNTQDAQAMGWYYSDSTTKELKVDFWLYTYFNETIFTNSENVGVINGETTTVCIDTDLKDIEETDWYYLDNFSLINNTITHSIDGTGQVYYQLEYTYRTNEAPIINLSTSDNQALGEVATFDVTLSDGDIEDTLTYTISAGSSPSGTDYNAGLSHVIGTQRGILNVFFDTSVIPVNNLVWSGIRSEEVVYITATVDDGKGGNDTKSTSFIVYNNKPTVTITSPIPNSWEN